MNAHRRNLILVTLLASACASAPKPLQGEFSALQPSEATNSSGEKVRWGGRILAVEPAAHRTCIEVLGQSLSANARPLTRDTTIGRFLACRDGFYDPAVFASDREITVTGRTAGQRERRIGEFPYRYPVVEADAFYLWPERLPPMPQPILVGYYGPGWGGFWGLRHYPPLRHGPWKQTAEPRTEAAPKPLQQ